MQDPPTLGSWNLENPCSKLSLLYQDEDVVVVHKPSGLLVHRSLIDRHETQFAIQILRDQLGQYVYPVHRLDKGTSGALVFALNKSSTQKLAESFSQRQTQKVYWALVRGWLPEQLRVDHPLKEIKDPIADKQARKESPLQEALTHFRLLERYELPLSVDRYPTSRYSLVEAIPETGRKHQIRRHLSHLRHPLIGDANHGVGVHNRFFREHYKVHRLFLAARSIEFNHPKTSRPLRIECPLEESFSQVIEQLRLHRNL